MISRTDASRSIQAQFEFLLGQVLTACQRHYGDRLVSVAVFGSVGRGMPRADSDIDLLIVADGLPNGRLQRIGEFRTVEVAVAAELAGARQAGLLTELSPVLKTPAEVLQGSPLLLDMVEDARLLYDRTGFLHEALDRLKARMDRLGARRIWRGNAWFWDLKPDYKPGEVFEL
jgi:predicted nucleotidyltransferase